jgi:hypothetical protein
MTNETEQLFLFLKDFAQHNQDSFEPEQIEILLRAADVIRQLDEGVESLIDERDDAYEQIDRFKNGFEGSCMACEPVALRNQELLKEVKDLTERHAHMSNIALGARADVHQTRHDLDKANKERDEARREVCFLAVFDPEVPHLNYDDSEREEARSRGWDCFKDT